MNINIDDNLVEAIKRFTLIHNLNKNTIRFANPSDRDIKYIIEDTIWAAFFKKYKNSNAMSEKINKLRIKPKLTLPKLRGLDTK